MITSTLLCLSLNIFFEARTENEIAKRAVAYTTINRTLHEEFPETVCEVVYQKKAFSWVKKKITHKYVRELIAKNELEREAWNDSVKVAYEALNNISKDPTSGATYFHRSDIKPSWTKSLRRVRQIGKHIFYKS